MADTRGGGQYRSARSPGSRWEEGTQEGETTRPKDRTNGPERCGTCGEQVYMSDRLQVDTKIFHKNCFRCAECHTRLRPDTSAFFQGKYYCKTRCRVAWAEDDNEEEFEEEYQRNAGENGGREGRPNHVYSPNSVRGLLDPKNEDEEFSDRPSLRPQKGNGNLKKIEKEIEQDLGIETEEEIRRLRVALSERESEVERHTQELKRLNEEVQRLSALMTEKEKETNTALAQLNEANDKIRRLEMENQRLQTQTQSFTTPSSSTQMNGEHWSNKEGSEDGDSEGEREGDEELPIYALHLLQTTIYSAPSGKKKNGSNIWESKHLFRKLVEYKAFDSNSPNSRLLHVTERTLKICIQRSGGDNKMLAFWLAFTTRMLHFIKADERLQLQSLPAWKSLYDPKVLGVQVNKISGGSTPDAISTFICKLQHRTLRIFQQLVSNLMEEVSPFLLPAILKQVKNRNLNPGRSGLLSNGNPRLQQQMFFLEKALKGMKDLTGILAKALFIFYDEYFIYQPIIQQFFAQIFNAMDFKLFNKLIKHSFPASVPHSGSASPGPNSSPRSLASSSSSISNGISNNSPVGSRFSTPIPRYPQGNRPKSNGSVGSSPAHAGKQASTGVGGASSLSLAMALALDDSLCTCTNAFQIKYALSELESWRQSSEVSRRLHYTKSDRTLFLHITEAANVLIMDKSAEFYTEEENVQMAFPHLNPLQILHILERFHPDELSPQPVAREVRQMLARMASRARNKNSEQLPLRLETPPLFEFRDTEQDAHTA
jgi:hypothetical protein